MIKIDDNIFLIKNNNSYIIIDNTMCLLYTDVYHGYIIFTHNTLRNI